MVLTNEAVKSLRCSPETKRTSPIEMSEPHHMLNDLVASPAATPKKRKRVDGPVVRGRPGRPAKRTKIATKKSALRLRDERPQSIIRDAVLEATSKSPNSFNDNIPAKKTKVALNASSKRSPGNETSGQMVVNRSKGANTKSSRPETRSQAKKNDAQPTAKPVAHDGDTERNSRPPEEPSTADTSIEERQCQGDSADDESLTEAEAAGKDEKDKVDEQHGECEGENYRKVVKTEKNSDGLGKPEGNGRSETSDSESYQATALHGCRQHWQMMQQFALEICDQKSLSTQQAKNLCSTFQVYRYHLREDDTNEGEKDDLFHRLNEKIDGAIRGIIEEHTTSREGKENLAKDLYLHVAPKAVELAEKVLVKRAEGGVLSKYALTELSKLLNGIVILCRKLYRWKAKPTIPEKVKSRTITEIKMPTEAILKQYQLALREIRAIEDTAQATLGAKRREEEKERQFQAHLDEVEARRRENFNGTKRKDTRGEHEMLSPGRPSHHQRSHLVQRQVVRERPEFYNVDNVHEDNAAPIQGYSQYDQLEEQTSLTDRSSRETSQDILEPTGRTWQREETVALLLLLQRHRGLDRCLHIQESIQQISRDVRKFGVDKLLALTKHGDSGTGYGHRRGDESEVDDVPLSSYVSVVDTALANAPDVLDDLGVMNLVDVEQQVEYLEALQAQQAQFRRKH